MLKHVLVMVWPVVLDADLESLANAIQQTPTNNGNEMLNETQSSVYLSIKKLKIYLPNDGRKLITWAYTVLSQRIPQNDAKNTKAKNSAHIMRDKINTALIELISESVVFLEATRERALDVLFNLVTVSMETINTMSWLLCFTINRRPSLLIPRLHQYLIYSLKIHQNPLLDTTVEHCTDDQKKLVALGAKTFGYLLKHQNALVRKSVIDLFEEYFGQMKDQDTAMESNPESFVKDDLQRYYLGYIFVLPKISPELIEACWTEMFKKLFQNDSAGTMFMYERESEYSRICTPSGEHSIVSVFPQWLSNVAFSKDSLIMKHALDVAVMLDTMAYDPRLNLGHLIPAGDKSILDSMRPSFEQLDLQPSSIDLVDWTISILESKSHVRGVDSLKIALFLMQLLIFKCDTEEEAAKMLVSIITQLDKPNVKPESSTGTRYLVLNLVASAETKWPNVFQVVLEKIFSHAIALHIADSEGSVSVEKILANLAMLFEETDEAYGLDGIRPGFSAFQTYIVDHWQQVLLLFVSHPSMECRAMGYRVLANSKLWKHTGANVQPIQISKMLTEAWFRHMKHRFLRITPQEREEEVSVLEELERLIVGCCQTLVLAKSILCLALDFIMQGALEIFPPVDPNVLQREKTSLLDKVRENKPAMEIRSQINRPPQFITMTNLFNGELDFRDKTYIDNIQRTARLFYSFRDSKETTREHTIAVSLSILSHLTSKWPRQKVSLEAYDNVLPKNIPYASDITTGNAFKDHPALFLIIEQCSAITTSPISDTTRSILVYFIAFWHMPEVAKETMTLKYATQLEETSRIMILLNSHLPLSLQSVYKLFPFMSAQDLGDILYQAIWPYIRWHSSASDMDIPGLGPTAAPSQDTLRTESELTNQCIKKLALIYSRRLKKLERVPLWHAALQEVGRDLALDVNE